MNECELNIDSPFYLGGTDPAEYGRIIASIVRTKKNDWLQMNMFLNLTSL